MYISCLILSALHNRTKREVQCPYELHRTLSKAWDDREAARILFRPEEVRADVVTVLVQSVTEPDWSRLDVPGDYLREIRGPKPVSFQGLATGQLLRFRLRCRPSKRIGTKDVEGYGKRRGLNTQEEIFDWLHRKGELGGFAVRDAAFDRVLWHDSKGGLNNKPLMGVVFNGVLRITDPGRFRETLQNGVGPQKAVGFGLLSVAPA